MAMYSVEYSFKKRYSIAYKEMKYRVMMLVIFMKIVIGNSRPSNVI